MAPKRPRRPAVAGVLSALLPGLGQFYNRQWAKGAAFLVGLLVLDAVFGASIDMITFLTSGVQPNSLPRFLIGSLALLGIAIWSIVDAARSAKGASE